MTPVPMSPTLTVHLFPELGEQLVDLLRVLEPDDWERETVCSSWSVRDIVAHLLDSALRRLSFERDGSLPGSGPEPESYTALVDLLNELNAQWVTAAKRLSPRLLTDLLEFVEPQLADHFEALDPEAPATFSVDWAGDSESRVWFDVARELTERWHHQQQIRLAVAAPGLEDPRLSEPVFDTFVRAVPYHYRAVDAAPGSSLSLIIQGRADYRYTLQRTADSWQLMKGTMDHPTVSITIDEESAWLMFSRGISSAEARSRSETRGDGALAEHFFGILGVMA